MTPRPDTTTRLGRLGAWCFTHRTRVLASWVAALVLVLGVLAPLAGDFDAEFTTPGSDSAAATRMLDERFADRSGATIDVVWQGPQGARAPAVRERVDALLADAQRLRGIGPPGPAEVSPDGRTGIVRLDTAGTRDADVPVATAERLLALAGEAQRDGVRVELGGFAIYAAQESEASPEAVGFLIAALVLLVTFGSVLAAGLPLVTAIFGLGIGTTLVGTLALAMDVPDFATPVAAMLGLGVGIDYALLVLTRYRGAVADGQPGAVAAAEALATAGRSVLVAGGTVVVALLGLFAMGLPFLYGVALSASTAVLVAVAAALTLLPALLGVLGPRVDALRIGRRRGATARPSRWVAWSRAIQRRPWTAAIAGTLAILALAAPIVDAQLGFPDAGNDPAATTTRQAYDLVADGFGPGANGPLLLVADTPAGTDPQRLDTLRERVATAPGVAAVSPPQASPAGDAAILVATPATAPQDPATQRLVEHLRSEVLTREVGRVHVGGATAAVVDQASFTASRLPLFVGAVLGVSFLLLLAAFRSVTVALKAGVMNLLSISAAYGAVALVAGGGWAGQLVGIDTATPVAPFIPVMMFAVLFGLSMDYEVFLLSRVREEFRAHGDNARAVADGLASTARVITAAAAIMVAVFGAFALTDDVTLKMIGIGLATAILVDATIVRMVLVPAVMQLLGRRNWWLPGWLDRLLPGGGRPAPVPLVGEA